MNHYKVVELKTTPSWPNWQSVVYGNHYFANSVNSGSGNYQVTYSATTGSSKTNWNIYADNIVRYINARSRWFEDHYYDPSICIEHDFDEEKGSSQYMISCDFAVAMKSVVPANKYISKQDTVEKGFDLMRGIASTMYAVRVYDRVLTEAEKLQNRVADICYYLDLDTSLLEEALASIPDAADSIYPSTPVICPAKKRSSLAFVW
jgi:hypothetical protein